MRKRKQMEVERWFDGESNAADSSASPDSQSPEAAAYAKYLRTVRTGVEARRREPAIRDEQFDAFMAGIREELDRPNGSRFRGFWALASMATASLLVAVSALIIVSGGAKDVAARTVVEEFSTELEGAVVDVETDDDGATVWIRVTREDLL